MWNNQIDIHSVGLSSTSSQPNLKMELTEIEKRKKKGVRREEEGEENEKREEREERE